MASREKVIFFANTDWYLFNFRLPLAEFVQSQGIEVVFLSPPGEHSQKLLDAGFRWEPMPMDRRSVNPFREAILLWQLFRLFRAERPTLVHGFTIKCAVYGSLAGRLARVPGRISAVAGLGYVFASESPDARILRPIVRSLLRLALSGRGSRLILQNPDDADLFRKERIVHPEKMRVILGSGVDCERFRPSAAPRSSTRRFRVILATRLLWEKGVGVYVEAARILRAEGRDIEFLLAGEPDPGNPASVALETIQAWTRDGVVRWLGHVEDMPTLLRTVDVMVLPSYYREGVPRVLVEGAATGLPLVTTDMPGCREIVSHGVNGFLVPPREAEPVARAVGSLQDEPGLARRMGQASREKALDEYAQGIVFERTVGVYGEVRANLSSGRYRSRGTQL